MNKENTKETKNDSNLFKNLLNLIKWVFNLIKKLFIYIYDHTGEINDCIIYPFLGITGLSLLVEKYKNSILGCILNKLLVVIFLIWIAIVVYKLCKKLIKLDIIWPLIISLVFLIICLIVTKYTDDIEASNTSFIIGIFFMEVYLIYCIVCSVYNTHRHKVSEVIVCSIVFVVLGYVTIYFSSYNFNEQATDQSLFNSLITIFSAIIGGGLTLGGVAWTIKHEKEEKQQQEIKKAKPIFDFSPILDQPIIVSGSKNCFPEDFEENYLFNINLLIDNSELSVLKLKQIFHDNKWFILDANTTVLQNRKVMLSFKFNEPSNIFLEIEDSLGNLYYYQIEVLNVALLNGNENTRHTVRNIKEISYEKITQVINKNSK